MLFFDIKKLNCVIYVGIYVLWPLCVWNWRHER